MTLKITVAQLNPVVGDVAGNTQKIRELYLDAAERGADLVVTPWLSVTGFPLGGLAGNTDLAAASGMALEILRAATAGRRAGLIVGALGRDGGGVAARTVALFDGTVIKEIHSGLAGDTDGGGRAPATPAAAAATAAALPFLLHGVRLSLLPGPGGQFVPVHVLRDCGTELLVHLATAAFRPGVLRSRVVSAGELVAATGLPLLSISPVGGHGEALFAGGSFLMDAGGRRTLQLPLWEECAMDCRLADATDGETVHAEPWPSELECLYMAMTTSLRDYAVKSGFTDVLLGMSGGLDSAFAAAVAGDALGAERVHCVRLPSRHTSDLSNDAAAEMCRLWPFDMQTVPIEGLLSAADSTLAPLFPQGLKKLTRENMQARARGYLLMTLSNDNNWLLLSTGNKSELSVGYSTLYGDMCGGFNPLKDVFKTTVFALARWRNANRPAGLRGPAGVVIPPVIISRPPSAELSPGQMDTDSLPPYPQLDAILTLLLEEGLAPADAAARGHDPAIVSRVAGMVRRAEYKRRQAAPGPDFSGCSSGAAAGAGRCASEAMPLVNRFDSSALSTLREIAEAEKVRDLEGPADDN